MFLNNDSLLFIFSNNLYSTSFTDLCYNYSVNNIKFFQSNTVLNLIFHEFFNNDIIYITSAILYNKLTLKIWILYVMFLYKIIKVQYWLMTAILLWNFNILTNYVLSLKYTAHQGIWAMLYESDKEIGSTEDYWYFAVIFFTSISLFILLTISTILLYTKIFTWLIGSFILISLSFLSIPSSVFYFFGVYFISYLKGSSSTSNIFVEFIFDFIAVSVVYIRVLVQNIRFVFIFGAFFEIFEWINKVDSNTFILFPVLDVLQQENASLNFIVLNTLLNLILYIYYIVHFLFYLLVQTVIYILICIWLFLFLYTSFYNKSTFNPILNKWL